MTINQNKASTLKSRIHRFILNKGLIKPGQKILVAVSGGADSICLLDILSQLQDSLNITLHIAHLNHQLRGQSAEDDAAYVAELSRQLGIPVTIESANVQDFKAQAHLSLEEAAREVRYRFLVKVAREIRADAIAVGHTLDDQAETILLHIIRGSGLKGLQGLLPYHTLQFSGEKVTVIRPLLETGRQETEKHCSTQKLVPCQDISNLSWSFLRNRVRLELIPLLKTYNARIIDTLIRLGLISLENQQFIEKATLQAWQQTVRKEGKTLIFSKSDFFHLSPVLQSNLLRMAIEVLLGTLKDIEYRHIDIILKSLNKPAGRRVVLPNGLVFVLEYDRYLLSIDPESLSLFPAIKSEFAIKVPGLTHIPGWIIEAIIVPPDKLSGLLTEMKNNRLIGCFDLDMTGKEIRVRARTKGDRFQPLGMQHPKKLGIFMIDARIPRNWRDCIPIFTAPHQIIWVGGWRIDDRVKVKASSRHILCLKIIPVRSDPAGGKD